MLESVLGIRLMLWVGGTIPTPQPELLSAIRSVTVTNDADSADGFQMRLAVGKGGLGEFDLLDGGALDLMNRVWIAAVVGVVPEVLIDGIITRHDLQPSAEPGQSILTVTGTDVTVMMDLDEKNDLHSNQPDSVIVTKLVARYAQYGLIPTVTPTTDIPLEIQRIPRQHETDLAFIRRAADRNGFVFYVEPVTVGVNRAYWGPVVRTGVPQPALTLGLGAASNLRSLSFNNDGLAPVGAKGTFIEPITKTAIPIPPLPALRLPPLAGSATPTSRSIVLRDTANAGPAETLLASVAAATAAPEPIGGQGVLDTARYGSVLRARHVVGVRGAGRSYDGFYYVRGVTHTMEPGSYTQSFRLSREGTGALLPVVVP
jgi:hypothetical protein